MQEGCFGLAADEDDLAALRICVLERSGVDRNSLVEQIADLRRKDAVEVALVDTLALVQAAFSSSLRTNFAGQRSSFVCANVPGGDLVAGLRCTEGQSNSPAYTRQNILPATNISYLALSLSKMEDTRSRSC